MKKLTKEQADWLTKCIMNNLRAGEFADVVYANDIEEAIKECTETEVQRDMLGFKVYTEMEGYVHIHSYPPENIKYNPELAAWMCLQVSEDGNLADAYLSYKQILSLRDNINKMLEYLNEQEAN